MGIKRMMRLLAGPLLICGMTLQCAAQAYVANELNSGFPTNTLHLTSSIDSVQMNNGNLHIDIPYLSMNGRGINVTGHFIYNSKSWAPMLTCDDDGYGCYAMIQPEPGAYFDPVVDQSGYTFNYSYGTGACFDSVSGGDVEFSYDDSVDSSFAEVLPLSNDTGQTIYPYTVITGVYLEGPDGTKYPFPSISPYVGGVDPRSGPGTNCPNLIIGPTAGYSSDGSQWYLDLTGLVDSTGNIAAYRKDGAQVFNYAPSNASTAQNFTLKDTNGNYIGYGPASTGSDGTPAGETTSTDTLGRIIPIFPGYYDSTGTFQDITVTYETVTINTSSCSTIDVNPPIPLGGGTTGSTPLCYESQSEYPGRQLSLPHIIQLPNGESYTIEYVQNSYGQPSSITLPTGAVISYQWASDVDSGGPILQSRTETVNGVSSEWQYQWSWAPVEQFSTIMETSSTYISKVTDPLGNDTTYQCATDQAYTSCVFSDVKYYSGSSSTGTLLKTVHTKWNVYPGSYTTEPASVTTTMNDANLVAQEQTDWEQITEPTAVFGSWTVGGGVTLPTGNVTEVRDYDYGQGSPGALIRKTDYRYLHQDYPSIYVPLNIYDRPTQITVSDQTGIIAQTTNSYDTTTVANANTTAPNHDPAYSTSFTHRGNLTQVVKLVNQNASLTTKTNTYDLYGNLRSTQDSDLNTTYYGYDDNYASSPGGNCFAASGGAQGSGDTQGYVTSVTNAKNQTTTKSYYPCSGLISSTTDPNGASTSQTYDLINAPLITTYPDNGILTRNYNGYALPLAVTTTLPGIANPAVSTYDGMGRLISSTAPNGATTYTSYDLLGRVYQQSNPTKCSSSPGSMPVSCSEPTWGVTTYSYDALGRMAIQAQPDGNKLQWCYDDIQSVGQLNCLSNASTKAGMWTDFSDGTGRHWQRVSDTLGRLTAVIEPDASNSPKLETDYQYNALDDLIAVNQIGNAGAGEAARTRGFSYDSLSRLLTSTNPESGTITYSYLNNGSPCAGDPSLPCSKTTPAANVTSGTVTTIYTYDGLNRMVGKSYSGTGVAAGYSCYQYDSNSSSSTSGNFIGRLVNEWTLSGTGTCSSLPASGYLTRRSILAYDSMGRIMKEQQCHLANCTTGVPYTNESSYDLAGNPISFTSSMHAINFGYSYDAVGRLLSLGSAWVDSTHPGDLLSIGAYTPAGAIQSMTLGPNINVTKTYDNRLRVTGETAQHP